MLLVDVQGKAGGQCWTALPSFHSREFCGLTQAQKFRWNRQYLSLWLKSIQLRQRGYQITLNASASFETAFEELKKPWMPVLDHWEDIKAVGLDRLEGKDAAPAYRTLLSR